MLKCTPHKGKKTKVTGSLRKQIKKLAKKPVDYGTDPFNSCSFDKDNEGEANQ